MNSEMVWKQKMVDDIVKIINAVAERFKDHEDRIKALESRCNHFTDRSLKPCPFCGTKPMIWDYDNTCQCALAECFMSKAGHIPVEEWNKRAGDL